MGKDQISLDREWIALMKEAKGLGISPQEVKGFLKSERVNQKNSKSALRSYC
ncbi:DNA-binding anti-repressor SinI [Bacillus aerolatus]|uniref:DNA-binding anti-repressor SinI n=1 Tax=Bacillus aerolatus TaxID=2653354 RepID=A0A6I1FWF8_9BACI|nr:anti-repressor SinI family protein [Bacillus aerolatus]KAB7707363.1 DNA-binding anti-repressor SinI [Bacillus aerolatus]